MSFTRTKIIMPTTKKHNTIVIGLCLLVAAGIWIIPALHNRHTFDYKTFKAPNGWGYDILVDNKLFIHQDCIPVIPTKKGFARQYEAQKVAQLVIQKLRNGKMPSVTKSDLDKIYLVKD
jgi:Domain of unknown function (DUF4907)